MTSNRRRPREADYSASVTSMSRLLYAFRNATCGSFGCPAALKKALGKDHEHAPGGYRPGMVWDPAAHVYKWPERRRS